MLFALYRAPCNRQLARLSMNNFRNHIPEQPFLSIDAVSKGFKTLTSKKQSTPTDVNILETIQKQQGLLLLNRLLPISIFILFYLGVGKAFENLKFPNKFPLKIIGVNDDSFVNETLITIATTLKCPIESLDWSSKPSGTSGRFVAITVVPLFENSSQIYAVYDVVGSDKRVKFVL